MTTSKFKTDHAKYMGLQVLRKICEEKNNIVIAQELDVKVCTIESYVFALRKLTKAKSRFGLAMYAIREGIYKIEVK